jgi:nicotinamidase-related amidase
MHRRALFALSLPLFLLAAPARSEPQDNPTLRLPLRTRVETFKGSGAWDEAVVRHDFRAKETALIICDMWDDHWCKNAAKRCAELAKKADPVVATLRARGVTIIHAPSECMGFYKDTPQRKKMAEIKKVEPPKPIDLPDPPLPVDASDGGCDDDKPARQHKAWTRQHPAITIAEQDLISDNGAEVYSLLKRRGIKNLLVIGVHTNMCVLHRSFAIKQMTRWGVRCVLVRDLTDAMYAPRNKPFVSHDSGTRRIIEHIEKYWCPTVGSEELLKALPKEK